MKKTVLTLCAVFALVSTISYSCENPQKPVIEDETEKEDEKEETSKPTSTLQVYLCFGQSNMQGSAPIEDIDKEVPERLLMMATTDHPNTNREVFNIYPAMPPLSNQGAQLSPADYFGRTMVQNLPDSVEVLLINVSVSGCNILLFDKDIYEDYKKTHDAAWFTNLIAAYDGNPYMRLVRAAQFAKKENGTIEGMILHQGETNTGDKKWPEYVKKIYNDLLTDLDLEAENVPIIVGEMVHENINGACSAMNPIIRTLPETIPTARVVSSDGCTAQSDRVHFDSDGVRQLGRRYAIEMLKAKGIKK